MPTNTRLYPPYIEGKISAQVGAELAIPFQMNRSVGPNEFDYITAQIKTVSTNQLIGFYNSYKIVNNIAYFKIAPKTLQKGQHYKIQLAYTTSNNLIFDFSETGDLMWFSGAKGTPSLGKEFNGRQNPICISIDGHSDQERLQRTIPVSKGFSYTLSGYYISTQPDLKTNTIVCDIVNGETMTQVDSIEFNDDNNAWKNFSYSFTAQTDKIDIQFYSENNYSFAIQGVSLVQGVNTALEENIGYYSTVGIFKYTTKPDIDIQGIDEKIINPNIQVYQGSFSTDDATEKEYSYSFELYNDTELIYSSGTLIHNANSPIDKFTLPINLNLGVRYSLVYTVTTANNLTLSKSYYIMESVLTEIPSLLNCNLMATLSQDDGYISIDLVASTKGVQLGGKFRLLRFVENNYEIINSFIIQSSISNDINKPTHIYKDFTIAQGVEYRYALQQCGENIFSQKLYSNRVRADFEDMFLYDGKRQLKMRFNPKISSFKTTILESKLDTLGGKYPFFFRNGNTSYKDFPISALISMLADENEFFCSWKESIEQDERRTSLQNFTAEPIIQTDLVALNLKRERECKLEVLNWLNDGQPKLFRSPTEGNYIVRLMNVSLSPNDTLGRMLHSFNAQAYEIMDNTFTNLLEHKLISHIQDIKEVVIGEIELNSTNNVLSDINTLHLVAIGNPGAQIELTFKDSAVRQIMIGNTMLYDVPVQNEAPIVKVKLIGTEPVRIQYDMSSQLIYPLLFNGKAVYSITQQETAAQFIGGATPINILQEIQQNCDNYNIMSLTLSVKPIADNTGFYSDVTIQKDASGTVYTRDGRIVNDANAGLVTITYEDDLETILNLSGNILYEDLEATYPNRWRMDSFGNITLTCDAFDDNHFKPKSIKLGSGVYANVYYSTAEYN